MSAYDAAIIGGGHNGLVCAAYLARGGRQVLVLEAAPEVGGAAVTREITPGFKVSACAHLLHMLHPQVTTDLKLERHGLRLSSEHIPTVALDRDRQHLTISPDALAKHSRPDAGALSKLNARLQRFAGALRPALTRAPPRLGSKRWSDRLGLMKLAFAIRRLGRDDMRELLRIAGMNVADLLEETLETDLARGALAFDAVLGTRLGPRSPNSVLTLLYRLAGENSDGLAHPQGGMGAVSNALAAAANAAGAVVRTDTPVTRVLVENDRACGVELTSGERIDAKAVISSADPRRTFLDLVGVEHLDTGFVRRIRNLRMRGTAAKLNLALDGLPDFTGLDPARLGGRMLIAPDIDYIERAFNHCKYGEYSEAPAIEITLPSIHDPTLAPDGKHVLSAIVQYAPYDLKQGWDSARDAFTQCVIDTISVYAPDLPDKIIAGQTITPLDLERDYRLTGGHWHHGELIFGQFLMLRPAPGAAQYATPVPGLYLCGAGAHPGGGVMGAAGLNAARRVLKEAA